MSADQACSGLVAGREWPCRLRCQHSLCDRCSGCSGLLGGNRSFLCRSSGLLGGGCSFLRRSSGLLGGSSSLLGCSGRSLGSACCSLLGRSSSLLGGGACWLLGSSSCSLGSACCSFLGRSSSLLGGGCACLLGSSCSLGGCSYFFGCFGLGGISLACWGGFFISRFFCSCHRFLLYRFVHSVFVFSPKCDHWPLRRGVVRRMDIQTPHASTEKYL